MTDLLLLPRLIGYVVLIFLPGAWVIFLTPLTSLSFWTKIILSAVVSPLVITLQFYLVRLLGVPFDQTVVALALINLPALTLLFRARHTIQWPGMRTLLAYLPIPTLLLVSFAFPLTRPDERLFTGHAWMHSDIIYMLANGELIPEEPGAAGVRLAYPWAGHVYQGVLSFMLDSPPAHSYFWTNLIWLLLIAALMTRIVAQMGGNLFTRATTPIWLFLGFNFLGFPLHLGDYRYTPWLLKFLFFNQMPLALGIFVALLYLCLRSDPPIPERPVQLILVLLLVSMGLIYPLLFPSALAVVVAKILAAVLDRPTAWRDTFRDKNIVTLLAGAVFAGLVSLAYFFYLFHERVGSQAVQLNLTSNLLRKIIDSIFAPGLYWAGLVLVFRQIWHTRRHATIVVLFSALTSLALYISLLIPPVVEYKFMFPVAICLAPFAALGLEPFFKRLGRLAIPAFAIITLVIASPFAFKMLRGDWPRIPDETPPRVDRSHFALQLDASEPYSPITHAIQAYTSPDAILIVSHADFDYTSLSRRPFYIPPPEKRLLAGINLTNDHLLITFKKIGEEVFNDRRRHLTLFYTTQDEATRLEALQAFLKLERPLAIVLETGRHQTLQTWLTQQGFGRMLFQDGDLILWEVRPEDVQIHG